MEPLITSEQIETPYVIGRLQDLDSLEMCNVVERLENSKALDIIGSIKCIVGLRSFREIKIENLRVPVEISEKIIREGFSPSLMSYNTIVELSKERGYKDFRQVAVNEDYLIMFESDNFVLSNILRYKTEVQHCVSNGNLMDFVINVLRIPSLRTIVLNGYSESINASCYWDKEIIGKAVESVYHTGLGNLSGLVIAYAIRDYKVFCKILRISQRSINYVILIKRGSRIREVIDGTQDFSCEPQMKLNTCETCTFRFRDGGNCDYCNRGIHIE